ncbi:hypothetical protein [Jiulongibacter sp. NS-SX5]|uniref:hypothetical protein n=1 Tax=Jiulongibacter sp. NS-SX5 TaxID=3463854 RepID=UPI004059BCDD
MENVKNYTSGLLYEDFVNFPGLSDEPHGPKTGSYFQGILDHESGLRQINDYQSRFEKAKNEVIKSTPHQKLYGPLSEQEKAKLKQIYMDMQQAGSAHALCILIGQFTTISKGPADDDYLNELIEN